MKSIIIKGITIIVFLTLIISFVTFRLGYFDGLKSKNLISPDGSTLNNLLDTIHKSDSLKRVEIMSSSKAIIIRDHTKIQNDDSAKVKIDSTFKIDPILYSSKSGIILKPIDLNKIKQDSSGNDSLKKQ